MSYDYMLIRGTLPLGLEQFAEAAMEQSVGEVEQVQAQIAALFPTVRWQELKGSPFGSAPGASMPFGLDNLRSISGRADEAEFHLVVEPDGQVRTFSMSRVERSDVERTARALGLVVIDEQSMELFGGSED